MEQFNLETSLQLKVLNLHNLLSGRGDEDVTTVTGESEATTDEVNSLQPEEQAEGAPANSSMMG